MDETADADSALMQRIQQGDQQAFNQLVNQYLHPLYRFAYRMLNNTADAEEVAQDTLVKVWRNAAQWQAEKAKLTTWIHSIAYHLCLDLLRRHSPTMIDIDDPDEMEIASPTDDYQQLEIIDQLEKGLQTLVERQRAAILLCYYQGLDNQEAAHILQISVDALESLLSRARRTLKKQLLA
ncbi:RNA polymerase sigma factor, sigma-70 family [Beggiatoa alba B18LD]|uniref:RNA polymerase sigma factor n=1 Tax=Beggiatoa alba B18LD TaxID=395493 RepID=I3CH10_9GAMM|nr:sigma-70 family RNA polymerase sigma factor [Beggiatoa alba]EIJ42903.1 RNA polymerase sigma factor, sigma-70 family [Beggiatoa alba B18LD]